MKTVIIGGVAGGASAAARLRRLDEKAEIIMFERGEFISFANCGLPYHVGNVIPERSSLLVVTPKMFRARTEIDVRTRQEVTAINREAKTVTVHNLDSGDRYEETYDKLVLATGSTPIRPPLPGIDDPDVMQLWSIPDMDRIKAHVDKGAKRAVVVGAGFIGLEVAENLRERGVDVDLVELMPQVLPTLDVEMARPLGIELEREGVRLHLGRKVVSFHRQGGADASQQTSSSVTVKLDDDTELETDFVVLSIGVRPNSELAGEAGLALSARGGIVVDEHLCTADPDVFAVGDAISVKDLVTGEPAQIPLAGPANRQGRTVADNLCGRKSTYKGSLGTAIVKVASLAAGSVGQTEQRLKAARLPYRKLYLHPATHATYYPGACQIAMKLLYADDGRILGVQAVGHDGIDKRIDVIATAMRNNLTVRDLAELELSYAPPFGSAKDAVNFAGMAASNALDGLSDVVHADDLPSDAVLLDVREAAEVAAGKVPGALHIPLGQLRSRLDELPKDQQIVAYCKVGIRGYLAERILKENGFNAANMSGGMMTWDMLQTPPAAASPSTSGQPAAPATEDDFNTRHSIDVTALQCPGPVVRLGKEIEKLAVGEVLKVHGNAPFRSDLEAWCGSMGHTVLKAESSGKTFEAWVRKEEVCALRNGLTAPPNDTATIVMFSNDLDKVMAAFIIATGLSSLGTKVTMFFTFWGLNVLRRDPAPTVRKDILSRMFGWMMPRGARKLALSKMHMLGMGTGMMKHVMAKKNVASLPELIQEARELGVRFIACDMAMDVMGIQREELLEQVDEVAGVANFAALTKDGGTTLFI